MYTKPRRGEIWNVEFPKHSEKKGDEFAGDHPAVVVSASSLYKPDLRIVVPMFTNKPPWNVVCGNPWILEIPANYYGLTNDTIIDSSQLTCISLSRFKSRRGECGPGLMSEIESVIKIVLALNPKYV